MTGGTGFLGSHFCTRLLADGHDVVSIDNYFTSSRRNLAHLLNHTRLLDPRHDPPLATSQEPCLCRSYRAVPGKALYVR